MRETSPTVGMGKGKYLELSLVCLKSRLISNCPKCDTSWVWYHTQLNKILLRRYNVKSNLQVWSLRVTDSTYLVPWGKRGLKGGRWEVDELCVQCWLLLFYVVVQCLFHIIFTWVPLRIFYFLLRVFISNVSFSHHYIHHHDSPSGHPQNLFSPCASGTSTMSGSPRGSEGMMSTFRGDYPPTFSPFSPGKSLRFW